MSALGITPIAKGNFSFLILGAPTDATLPKYVSEFKQRGVKRVVRVCEPTYAKVQLEASGITVHELPFTDGDPPPKNVIDGWLKILNSVAPGETVAVHCIAGLGRAPILVAIALVELANMDALEAIEHIRKARSNAFNHRQITFLISYRRRSSTGCCSLM